MTAHEHVCPDCGRRFTGEEMTVESTAYLEAGMAALAEQLHTDATFARMTGLASEADADRLQVIGMSVHPDNIPEHDEPEPDDAGADVDPWTGERCWECTLKRSGD
jgi:hypothetical protein